MTLTRRTLLSGAATLSAAKSPSFRKGVNFTAEWGAPYGSDEASQMLKQLPAYGIDSIALVPYGMMRPSEPEIRYHSQRSMERDSGIERLTAEAHQLGISVLLKPQVWVHRGFIGDLDIPNEADRAKFFASYGEFAKHYAQLAASTKADLFCVGTEFVKLSRHVNQWRALINASRKLYSGPITYAANFGPEFEQLPFAADLDFVGLNNYYPLADDLSFTEIARKIEQVHAKSRRPILFTEAGYSSLQHCHRQPWDETPRNLDLPHQARCYDAMFKAFYAKPWLQGMYFWKVGTNGFGGAADGSHTPWNKPAMDVVKKWYRSPRPQAQPARVATARP